MHDFFRALRPPADDAANEHEDATIPDEGREGIEEDANGSLGGTLPVGQKDVEVGEAKGRDGDEAGRLVVEVFVEDAARVDVRLQLAVMPDLHDGFDGIGARISFFKIAEI